MNFTICSPSSQAQNSGPGVLGWSYAKGEGWVRVLKQVSPVGAAQQPRDKMTLLMRRLPQDIESLVAIAVRDAIWFKDKVMIFLQSCGVPPTILREVRTMYAEKAPTIRAIQHVFNELEKFGPDGLATSRMMLTKIHNWKGISALPIAQQKAAKEAIAALQGACKQFIAELEFEERRRQEELERRQQQDRSSRVGLKQLDHAKLQQFRDEFQQIFVMADSQQRGVLFEKFMNQVFDYYAERSEGPFRRVGEQLDGIFYFDKHPYYVEIRWKKEKTSAADISVLRDRAKAGFGGDTKALFVSFEGYSPECLESLMGRTDERVLLMDGGDLLVILQGEIGFDVLLAEKQMDLVRTKKPFISAYEIVKRRKARI